MGVLPWVSMEELATELNVTPNAVSERLQRAEQRVFSTLTTSSDSRRASGSTGDFTES